MNVSESPSFMGNGHEFQYRERLAGGSFDIQKCGGCTAHVFYPRVICPYCGADALAWVKASGKATVYSTSVVRRKDSEGGPYNVAIVALAEGPRMMTRVEDIAPDAVKIGMAVTAKIVRQDEVPVVVFTPSAS
ncbi:MAG: OB-fold domain-containing protein [Parvibaculum sp.]|uniref:Zn-ribbon domain-containing OB-fold protein n=1 Tax=Parvibaculum sp. TaxID=2024848 RepID=UPI003C76CB86